MRLLSKQWIVGWLPVVVLKCCSRAKRRRCTDLNRLPVEARQCVVVEAPERSPCIDSPVPPGKGPGSKVEADNGIPQKLLLNRAAVDLSQNVRIPPGERRVAKEGLIRANPKRDNGSWLREVSMYPIDYARPYLAEAVVKNDNSALHQRAFAGGEVMPGNLGGVPSIDTDDAQRAAAKLKQVVRGKLRRISLVNDESAAICMGLEILLKAFKIACARVVDVQFLV